MKVIITVLKNYLGICGGFKWYNFCFYIGFPREENTKRLGTPGEALGIFLVGGVPLGLLNPYPIPDHVQLILQPYTRLYTKNPYPIPDVLFLSDGVIPMTSSVNV